MGIGDSESQWLRGQALHRVELAIHMVQSTIVPNKKTIRMQNKRSDMSFRSRFQRLVARVLNPLKRTVRSL